MNRKSSAQVHELPLGIWWIDNSLKSTFSIFLTTHECREVLKAFPGPGCLHSEDIIVWLLHFLINLLICIHIVCISNEEKHKIFRAKISCTRSFKLEELANWCDVELCFGMFRAVTWSSSVALNCERLIFQLSELVKLSYLVKERSKIIFIIRFYSK